VSAIKEKTIINIGEILNFTKEEKSRYKNKSHKEACLALENYSQKLETDFEVLLTWYSKQGKEIDKCDLFILNVDGFKNIQEAILGSVEELKKDVKKINQIRKFLEKPYSVGSSFGFGCIPETYYPYD